MNLIRISGIAHVCRSVPEPVLSRRLSSIERYVCSAWSPRGESVVLCSEREIQRVCVRTLYDSRCSGASAAPHLSAGSEQIQKPKERKKRLAICAMGSELWIDSTSVATRRHGGCNCDGDRLWRRGYSRPNNNQRCAGIGTSPDTVKMICTGRLLKTGERNATSAHDNAHRLTFTSAGPQIRAENLYRHAGGADRYRGRMCYRIECC